MDIDMVDIEQKKQNEENVAEFELEGVELVEVTDEPTTQKTLFGSVATPSEYFVTEEEKTEKKRKTKAHKKSQNSIAKLWTLSHEIFFKKLGESLSDEEKNQLEEATADAMEYIFPSIEGKINPLLQFAIVESVIILPRIPSIVEVYQKNKKQKETENIEGFFSHSTKHVEEYTPPQQQEQGEWNVDKIRQSYLSNFKE